jgi:hypothetical protein
LTPKVDFDLLTSKPSVVLWDCSYYHCLPAILNEDDEQKPKRAGNNRNLSGTLSSSTSATNLMPFLLDSYGILTCLLEFIVLNPYPFHQYISRTNKHASKKLQYTTENELRRKFATGSDPSPPLTIYKEPKLTTNILSLLSQLIFSSAEIIRYLSRLISFSRTSPLSMHILLSIINGDLRTYREALQRYKQDFKEYRALKLYITQENLVHAGPRV